MKMFPLKILLIKAILLFIVGALSIWNIAAQNPLSGFSGKVKYKKNKYLSVIEYQNTRGIIRNKGMAPFLDFFKKGTINITWFFDSTITKNCCKPLCIVPPPFGYGSYRKVLKNYTGNYVSFRRFDPKDGNATAFVLWVDYCVTDQDMEYLFEIQFDKDPLTHKDAKVVSLKFLDYPL